MTEQNSVVVPQIRPEQAMEQLGIKKDAYYEDLKFLGIKANRDSEGKSYLDESQFELLKKLRLHVDATGKRDGFVIDAGHLMTTDEDAIADQPSIPEPQDPVGGLDEEMLYREASEVAGSRMTAGEQVIL